MTAKTVKKRGGKPFKKGDKRINRKGRPKGAGISITTEIKRELESIPKGHKSTYLQLLIKKILKKAILDGDGNTIRQIWSYVDGMPKQFIEQEFKNPLLVGKLNKKTVKLAKKYEEELKKTLTDLPS